MKKMNNKGFSLVELIIVVAIMAILIGVLAPQYMKYVDKSRVSADKDLLDSIYGACTTAASDPDLTGVPTPPTTAGTWDDVTSLVVTGTGMTWGDEVLNTLDATSTGLTGVAGKLKSNAMKGKSIMVEVNSGGSYRVSVTGSADPADPNGGPYTVPQQY